MKVLLISHQFPSREVPYRGRFVEDQIRVTKPFGVEFFVLQVEPEGLRPGNVRNFLRAFWFGFFLASSKAVFVDGELSGVRLYSPGIRLGGGVQAVINALVAVRWMCGKNLLKTFDCIHAHTGLSDGLIAFVLSRLSGKKPYMITEHSAPYEMLFKGVGGRFIVSFVAKHASAVVAVSSFLRDCIHRHFPKLKVEVVGNAYDSKVFRLGEESAISGAKRILWIGHISPRKRLGLAFETLATLREMGTNAVLRILTSSTLDSETEEALERSGVQNFVSMARADSREEVAAELRGASALLVTSEVETFGMTVLEALATGVPVVSTDCGGPRDILIDEGDGYVDPVGSPASLAVALQEQLKSSSFEARRHRSQRVELRFGLNALGGRYFRKYTELSQHNE